MKNYIPVKLNTLNKIFLGLIPMFLFIMFPLSIAMARTTVSTYPVSTITKTSVIMNGYVASTDGFSDVWFEFGTSSGNLDKKTNQIVTSNNQPFKISSNRLEEGTRYFYRAIVVNEDGISSGSINNFITTGNPVNTPSNNTNNQIRNIPIGDTRIGTNALPFVITNFPQNVTSNSAIVKGQSIPSVNSPTSVWFEWGTSQNALTRVTPRRNVSTTASENFEETLTGLTPNTFYFYRAVIRNQNGEGRGDMIRMKTLTFIPPTTITPRPQPTTPKLIKAKAPITKPTSKIDPEDQTAAVLSDFFPNTLIGWLILLALLIFIITLSDHMYGERQKRKEEKKLASLTENKN